MDDRKVGFEAVFDATYEAICGYALRRRSSSHDAADVVAETFAIAWRRVDQMPTGDAARLWLYGVARRVLANHRRGERQRRLRTTELRDDIVALVGDPLDASSIAEAFRALSDADREILGLVAWEGLDRDAIATVLGCSRSTARVRLHRARTRFSHALRSAGVDAAPMVMTRSSTKESP
ncbi:sigma-70 family RNA polymerase sigma factor [Actinoallomurus bryophytorum]|uniref:RNA polymerase ECF family sigma subunit n=1 Tax=Actinoallomurus bryophytorum TaxID=1490222 RepID=A0A543C120_9ACTN|nr:sigma-70 family RNA polymerase sigma factor [Actinoallomurus bryophytorum]TQL90789.1 RNA polymerase ECF family sigma subunit [Actinoallomurus bryophytorum]